MNLKIFMHKKSIPFLAIVFFLTLVLALILGQILTVVKNPVDSVQLTVSAAISLKETLQEIQNLYQTKQPNIQIFYNFGSSGSLQQQIEQGAPVDLFISAGKKQMDTLQSQNLLLPQSRLNLLTNQMVLITPKTEQTINQFQDLTQPEVKKIALGEPRSVPAGQYGEEVLKYYHIFDIIKPKIIYGKDVRQVLTYVETANVNAGLVYVTDAQSSNLVRIAATAPNESHQPIVYPVAILKDSKNITETQAFLQFLSSNSAKTIFKKYGFGT